LAGNEHQPGTTDEKSLAELVTEVSEHASILVREEIELARAEIEQKLKRIARGAVAGAVAGVFFVFALIYLLESAAWGLNDLFEWNGIWPGFLVVGLLLVLFGVVGGLIAVRSLQSGAPPTPDQAIEEAKLIKEAIEHPEVQAAMTTETAKERKK
jgi:uncharacterized membrane protein YqjE